MEPLRILLLGIDFGLHLSCSLLEGPKPFFKREPMLNDAPI
jgi:hypothetical protein